MTDKEKLAKLAELTKNIQNAIEEAEKFADEHDLDFGISPAYGMGGHYYGKNTEERKEYEEYNGDDNGGWRASSQGC